MIRIARADELDAIARVLADAFGALRPPPDDPIAADFERYLAEVTDVRARRHGTELFVAEDGGALIGAATLYLPGHYEPAVPGWPDTWAGLRLNAVVPEARGRGVGRALSDARIARARALGASAVGLHTSTQFAVSREMYRRSGWARVPHLDYAPVPGHPELVAEAYCLALA